MNFQFIITRVPVRIVEIHSKFTNIHEITEIQDVFKDISYINVNALLRSEMTYPKGTVRPSNTTSASDTASTTDTTEEAAEAEAEAEVEAGDAAAAASETTTTTTTSTVDPNIQQKIDSIKNVASTSKGYIGKYKGYRTSFA